MTLAEFLLARVAEDEVDARTALDARATMANADGAMWVVTGADNPVGVDYDPERVLAECQARRAIIELHASDTPFAGEEDLACCTTCHDYWHHQGVRWPCATILALAQPFKGHPDFDPAWAVCAAG